MPCLTPVRRGRYALVTVAAASAALLATAGCGSSPASSSSAGTSNLRIGYNPNPTNLTIVVAQQEGLFAKNGLNVTLTPLQNASAEVPALGRQFDLLTTTPMDVLHAAQQGLKPVVVEGQTIEATGKESTGLMVSKGIASVSDLRGKTIAVPGLAGALYGSLIVELHSAGLSASDVKIVQVPFGNMFDQLKSGRIAAALTIVPYTGQMKAAGFTQLADPVLDLTGGHETPSAMWSAASSWAAANQATITKFRAAQQDALNWINANDAQARQLLVTQFHLPAAVAKIYPITEYFSFPVTAASLQQWVQPLESVGLLQSGGVTSTSGLVLSGA